MTRKLIYTKNPDFLLQKNVDITGIITYPIKSTMVYITICISIFIEKNEKPCFLSTLYSKDLMLVSFISLLSLKNNHMLSICISSKISVKYLQ